MPAILPSETERERAVLGSYWLPFQQRWINDRSRKKILEKCRRSGGSYAESFSVVEDTGTEGARFDAWIGSRDKLAARLFIEDCKAWARKLAPAFQDLGEVLIGNPEQDLRAFDLEMASGRRIHSLSSNPDAFAGKQGRITLDEAALHKDLRQLYAIAQPAIMRLGRLSLISTHRGSANYFNVLAEEVKHKGNPKKFSLHSINIVDAVKEGLWIKIKAEAGPADERAAWTDDDFLQSLKDECADEEMWLQEYMCQPCDDAAALLTWDDILACTVKPDEPKPELDPKANRYLGFDVARRKHLSVIVQFAEHNGRLVQEELVVMQGKSFAEQETVLFQMLANPQVKACRIDATGLGMQIAENATTKFPGKVKGLMLSAPEKLRLAVQLQRRFQDRSIRIADDSKLHYDLYSVKKQFTAGDNILLRSEAGSTDGHADRFWSFALGADAAAPGGAVPITLTLC